MRPMVSILQQHGELHWGNPAAGKVFPGFYQITFSRNSQCIGKNRIFKELDVTVPALYSLGMDPVVLLASFGSVGALQPDLLVQ